VLIRPSLSVNTLAILVWTALACPAGVATASQGIATTIQNRIGGGNFSAQSSPVALEPRYGVLNALGAKLSRIPSTNYRESKTLVPTPAILDAAIAQSHAAGITPIILFEYDGTYLSLDPPIPIGSYEQWFALGQAYARRFGPNGSWQRENGVKGWGVTMFQAFNEPDIQNVINKKEYHNALAGLADGVHSINPDAKIFPGGFGTCNSALDPSLRGYGPAIADLLNSGQLAGIDLHTYYSAWFPMSQGRYFSAQGCFDRVKSTSGVIRDIDFLSTEFNFSMTDAENKVVPADVAAKGFLTGLWDNLGVVRSDGATSATILAFPWNLFDTPETTVDSAFQYGMAKQLSPWLPDARGKALQWALCLSRDMNFVLLDPNLTGKSEAQFVLLNGTRTLYVWQDIPGWTLKPGKTFTFTQLPANAGTLSVYGFDGLRKTVNILGLNSYTVEDLPGNETYMFLIEPK
jgi:hypothetical protein